MVFKVTFFIKKREDITLEEFSSYWDHQHANLFVSQEAVKKNLVKYSQFHLAPQYNEKLASLGMVIAPYDGIAEIWVEEFEDILAYFSNKDTMVSMRADHKNFVDQSSPPIVLIGEEHEKWKKP
ncbi:hypothetical protein QCA50_011895 [Cerrena zonata]|uniref:EthD domain-containing protein n=1 Tax=Cerrena zonata TaxID=2478898 RepID=A0AAW0FTV5_9APHY